MSLTTRMIVAIAVSLSLLCVLVLVVVLVITLLVRKSTHKRSLLVINSPSTKKYARTEDSEYSRVVHNQLYSGKLPEKEEFEMQNLPMLSGTKRQVIDESTNTRVVENDLYNSICHESEFANVSYSMDTNSAYTSLPLSMEEREEVAMHVITHDTPDCIVENQGEGDTGLGDEALTVETQCEPSGRNEAAIENETDSREGIPIHTDVTQHQDHGLYVNSVPVDVHSPYINCCHKDDSVDCGDSPYANTEAHGVDSEGGDVDAYYSVPHGEGEETEKGDTSDDEPEYIYPEEFT